MVRKEETKLARQGRVMVNKRRARICRTIMDTSLTASVATFRVFSPSNKPGVRPHDAQVAPPNAQDRMAATPVTEGPLLLSKLASNEVTYLQVNAFTRAIMARSRIWRVAPRELVIPASFSTYWLVTLHGPSRAISRLDKTLKSLCKYEVVFDVSQFDEEPEEDSTDETDVFLENDDSSVFSDLSPQHNARVLNARQIISRGKMSQMLNDVNESQTPWSVGSAARPRVKSEPFLNTPPVTPPSNGNDKVRSIGLPGPPLAIEIRDLAVPEPRSIASAPSPKVSAPAPTVSAPTAPTVSDPTAPIVSDPTVSAPNTGIRNATAPNKTAPTITASNAIGPAPTVAPTSTPNTNDSGISPPTMAPTATASPAFTTHTSKSNEEIDTSPLILEELASSCQPKSIASLESTPLKQNATRPILPSDTRREGTPLQTTGNPSASDPKTPDILMDKFAPRFSHPLIPSSHITQFYPRTSSISSLGHRPPTSLPKRDLTSIGPSNLHQEVTTVGGYIGLRAVRGLFRKT